MSISKRPKLGGSIHGPAIRLSISPIEEIERFGKRRKLNDADRKRLSTTSGDRVVRLFRPRLRTRQLTSERDAYLNGIQIRIDGQPADGSSAASTAERPSQPSSQSIVLCDDSGPVHYSSTRGHPNADQNCSGRDFLSLRPSHQAPPSKVPKAPSTIPETVMLQISEPVSPSRVPLQENLIYGLSGRNRVDVSPGSARLPWSARRHFTIDDQIQAEQNNLAICLDANAPSRPRSPSSVTTLLASPSLLSPEIPPSLNASNRPLQPRWSMFSPNFRQPNAARPQEFHGFDVTCTNSTEHPPYHIYKDRSFGDMRFFGQVVRQDD